MNEPRAALLVLVSDYSRTLMKTAQPFQNYAIAGFLIFFFLCSVFLGVSCSVAAEAEHKVVTTAALIEQMSDLERLARWPDPPYRTVQFSSYDRRSTTSERPNWFANADGFGGEPIPNFLKVLREPRDGQPGLYLVAEVSGPGAIVRGWSAGMEGVLRVCLDPPEPGADGGTLVWEGPAYEFLARRSSYYLKRAQLEVDAANAFSQTDADYFPIPFARGLRVTWQGHLNELHFYHLQVRQYPPGTEVRSFDPKQDVAAAEGQIRRGIGALLDPAEAAGEPVKLAANIEPGQSWNWSGATNRPGAIRQLKLRLSADKADEVLRSCLLRISFDSSQRPQVESPVGDFFGSGPGVNPFSSLPFTVAADGTMTCRFVMPYEQSVRLELVNYSRQAVQVSGAMVTSSWGWDSRSMYFRAKWRADHDLLAGVGALDLPYAVVIGQGVFAGCAAMLMNPSGVPTAGGNWWGEGDEKFLVDGESTPSTFGTGSEDYFNYSWSRPDLFSHPYCGQPLDSGPDTSGYISNHRFQIMDAIPFEKSFGGFIELRAHNRTPGLSYGRIAYHYARPNAIDDHRAVMPSDLRIPPLPKRQPLALGGARGARFFFPEQLQLKASSGKLEVVPFPLATQLQLALWHAEKGAKLEFQIPVEKAGRASMHLVTLHRPDGAVVRVLVNGTALTAEDGKQEHSLRSGHAPRILNVNCKPASLAEGSHTVTLECLEPGVVGLDYIWVREEAPER